MTEYGLFWLFYNGGTAVNYRWGVTHPPGFKAAKAVIDYWLDDGKIVGVPRDRDRPRRAAAEDPRRGGQRLRLDDHVLGPLERRARRRSAPASASLVSDANGRFKPMTKLGDSTVVKYRYLWSTGSNATQTDTLSADSPPTIHSKIVVKGEQKFKISLVLRPLKRRPSLPLKNRSPLPPVPAPFCKKSQ